MNNQLIKTETTANFGAQSASDYLIQKYTDKSGLVHHHSESSYLRGIAADPDATHILHNAKVDEHKMTSLGKLIGVPTEHRAFPGVRKITFDPEASATSIALSAGAHRLHADGTFAKVLPSSFLLGFSITDPNGGGISLIMRLADILGDAPVWVLRGLEEGVFRIARMREDGLVDEYVGPLLSENENGELILRWRFDEQVQPVVLDEKGQPARAALAWLRNKIEEVEPIEYAAQPGDIIYVKNTGIGGVLHGRTALSEELTRVAWRLWLK